MLGKQDCIYFAHPINTYGSLLEDLCLILIKKEFPDMKILNPSDGCFQDEFQEYRKKNPIDYMQYFARLVIDNCTHLVYLPFMDGMIGAGIWYEAHSLVCDNLYEIDWMSDKINKVTMNHIDKHKLTIDETRARIKKLY